MRDENPDAVVMAGNVVTGDMTEALILAGADIVKIGIGPGSVCTTRRVTGVGYPQLSAIIECADAAHGLKGQVCADGGCTVPGDIAKAFGAGADFVMLGGMLAGHDECEGEIRYEDRDGERVPVAMTFYGMSSEAAMKKYAGGVAHYRAAEGKTVETPYRGAVERHARRDHGRRALDDDLHRRDTIEGGAQAHDLRARDRADERRVRERGVEVDVTRDPYPRAPFPRSLPTKSQGSRRVEEVDYLVLGAGSAGCVVASRLSEDAGTNVALIEAGGGATPG